MDLFSKLRGLNGDDDGDADGEASPERFFFKIFNKDEEVRKEQQNESQVSLNRKKDDSQTQLLAFDCMKHQADENRDFKIITPSPKPTTTITGVDRFEDEGIGGQGDSEVNLMSLYKTIDGREVNEVKPSNQQADNITSGRNRTHNHDRVKKDSTDI